MLNIFLSTENKKDPTVAYLTGYSPMFCILAYDSKTKRKCMFVASFERTMYKGIKCFGYDERSFGKTLFKYFGKRRFTEMGINKSLLSIKELSKLRKLIKARYVDISKIFANRRMIKSSAEIAVIRKACSITDKIFSGVIKSRKAFRTEHDISAFIKKKAIDLGVEMAFEPVVATSSNASKPHHVPEQKKLRGFTIIDFGVKYKGYCSDMTRMLYFGKPKKKELEAYELLLGVQEKAVKMLRKGILFKDVDKFVRDKLKEKFTHSLGHGIGVDVHELPHVSPKSKHKLEEGMTFTIEPGVYYSKSSKRAGQGFGIRIEDSVVFFRNKVERMTKSSKKLVVV